MKEKAMTIGKEQVADSPEQQEQDSILKCIGKEINIIEQDFSIDLFKGKSIRLKRYITKPAKAIVGVTEYELWKPIYEHVDALDICQEYKDKLCKRFVQLNIHLKRLYYKYANKLVCLDANIPLTETACFSACQGGFKFNQYNDMNEDLGVCNTYFHETAHMIDWLMGNAFCNASSNENMTGAIYQDYQAAIKNIKKQFGCDDIEAQVTLTCILKQNTYAALVASDVFDGASGGKVYGRFRHGKDRSGKTYWEIRLPDALGKEAFAEIWAGIACQSTAQIAFTQQYLPQTMLKFNNITKGC
jgi:hypothetical protein